MKIINQVQPVIDELMLEDTYCLRPAGFRSVVETYLGEEEVIIESHIMTLEEDLDRYREYFELEISEGNDDKADIIAGWLVDIKGEIRLMRRMIEYNNGV